jgi:prefoldin subunit 5
MLSRIMGQLQTLQRQYSDLNARVQQINLNVERCLQHLEPKDD